MHNQVTLDMNYFLDGCDLDDITIFGKRCVHPFGWITFVLLRKCSTKLNKDRSFFKVSYSHKY